MSSTFDNVVDEVLQTLYGYGLSQPRAAFLASGINNTATTITVGDASDFEQGVAEIGNELVFIDSVNFTTNTLTLSPDGRGYYGSTAATYTTGTRITMAPTWPRSRVATAINDAILGTYPTLYGLGTTTLVYSPVQTTYALPTGAMKVLRVSADTIGPSQEKIQINRWYYDPAANALTLEQGGAPGKNINVTYAKTLTSITFGSQFTASGLQDTARAAVKYAACSHLLAYMDPARLPVDTAVADEYDPSRNGVGNATRISAQLYQRYLIELENERKRLREIAPTPVAVRTR